MEDAGLLVLRVIGVTFAGHGFQKLFGWFGGGGLDATAAWFDSLGFHGRRAAVLAGLSEIAGGLGLATGTFTPLAAAAVVGTMTVAAIVAHADNGFWSANNGWELNFVLAVWAVGLATAGPGRWSVDHALGLDLASPLAGALALLLGVAGAAAQLATRDRTRSDRR